MAQWTNLNQNNIFVNPTCLPLLCEKSGAMHLAEPGLTTVAGSGHFSIIFQVFLSYFSIISRKFLTYFPFLSYFSLISQLFLTSQ